MFCNFASVNCLRHFVGSIEKIELRDLFIILFFARKINK